MNHILSAFRFSKNTIINHKYLASLTGLVIIYLGYHFLSGADVSTITVQYGRVRKGVVSETVSGTGQVSATSQVELKPKVNANVTQVLVTAGDKVYKGQVLFRLDARDAYKQVRDAQLSLDQANVALEKLKQPAETIDILALENSIKKAQTAKISQDTSVANAFASLLSGGLQAVPDVSYTTETAPTITGTYIKKQEGQIRINVSQGTEGASLPVSGLVSTTIIYSSSVGQPIGDTGLYIKFNANQSYVNWLIDIPNKRSTSYLSLYNAYINAMQNRDNANADSDRQIAEYTEKLNDLKRGAKDIDLTAQELSVKQRENALLDANATLSDYTIVAPFAGTMANVSAQVGLSAVTAASNGATSLGTIVTDKKIAQITLNEVDIAKVHVGQLAKISFDAIDGVSATGTVADIDGLGTVTQGVVTYKVKIYFDSVDPRIKPSMSVSADIITNSKDDVLTLPSSAVKHDASGYYVETDGLEDGDQVPSRIRSASSSGRMIQGATTRGMSSSTQELQNRVFFEVRASSSTVLPITTVFTKIPVTIGIQGDSLTEITGGLNEGQRVIVKKTTTSTSKTSAPSVTSLLRPGGQQQRSSGAAIPSVRGQ